MQTEMNIAAPTAIYNLREKIESLAVQQNKCNNILSRILPVYTRILSLCDEIMTYLDLGMLNAAGASRAVVSFIERLDNEETDENA